MKLTTEPAGAPLRGELTPPGDKSISHRALIFACLAHGPSRVRGLLDSADVRATASACEQLGMAIQRDGREWLLEGVGERGLQAPGAPLDMGNSGTAMRLLAGVLAAVVAWRTRNTILTIVVGMVALWVLKLFI
jgi:3-phosphoshikimate 1-carboxyvinyltransferase